MASIGQIQALVERDDEGAVVPIFKKNGDPYLGMDGEPSTFTVVGSESKLYRGAKHAHMRRLQKRARRSGGLTETPEQMAKDSRELIAAAVIAFSGWDDGKKELPFTPENVKELLVFDHIFEQVNVGVQGHADFSSAGSES